MKTMLYSRILILSGLAASLITIILFALAAASTAVAGPQADAKTFLPIVVSPLVPVDAYETDFNDGIEPWKKVRWTKGATTDVEHNGSGYLDVEVNTKDSYVIVSPLVPGPHASYNLIFHAKLHDRKDKAQYGAIFGGDWDGAPCPGDNTDGCFNHYFEFRVRYRDVNGVQSLEYRIRRVDGHDGNNTQDPVKDLVDWTTATNVDPEDWNKWEVHYGTSGHIRVKANNQEQAESARDGKYTQSRYFGLYAKAGDNGDTEASFDKFSIVREE
jgi:hypothetical protein